MIAQFSVVIKFLDVSARTAKTQKTLQISLQHKKTEQIQVIRNILANYVSLYSEILVWISAVTALICVLEEIKLHVKSLF